MMITFALNRLKSRVLEYETSVTLTILAGQQLLLAISLWIHCILPPSNGYGHKKANPFTYITNDMLSPFVTMIECINSMPKFGARFVNLQQYNFNKTHSTTISLETTKNTAKTVFQIFFVISYFLRKVQTRDSAGTKMCGVPKKHFRTLS